MASSAYRAGVALVDERTGLAHDYTRRDGVVSAEIVLPDGGTADRSVLWNAAEAAEKRKDGRTAREWVIALPSELDDDDRRELARSFGVELARRYGVAVDVAVHAPDRGGDQRNHHAHVLTTTRQVERTPTGVVLGEKATIEQSDTKRRAAGLGPAADDVTAIRGLWEEMANAALERAGRGERIDRRSLAAQGIEREPTIHLGPVATEMERRGRPGERSAQNDRVKANNTERAALIELVFKADVGELAQKPIPEIRAEVERRKPPTFEQMALEHPAIVPTVNAWERAQRGAQWCTRRLSAIANRVRLHLGKREVWAAEGGVWRGVQKLARNAGAAFGALAVSDAWLEKQDRQRARTEHVQTQRQEQALRLAAEVKALAAQHRPEIERMRVPLIARHDRAAAVLDERMRSLDQERAAYRAQRDAKYETDRIERERKRGERGPGRGR